MTPSVRVVGNETQQITGKIVHDPWKLHVLEENSKQIKMKDRLLKKCEGKERT